MSPDGTRVASTFHHRDDLNCTSLHVTDIATSVDVAVAGTPDRNVRSPAWSPDGRLLAYADESPGWYEVFVVSCDGSAPGRQLTDAGADFAELRWSPDGARILAVRFRHGVGDLVVDRRGDWCRRRVGAGRYVVVADLARRRVGGGRPRVAHDAAPPVPHRRRRPGRAARPDPGSRQGGTARRPRTRQLPLARRTGGLRLALPPRRGLGRAPGSGDRLPPRRPDVVHRRRMGRHRPVLHRQGLRLVLAQLPRQHDVWPRRSSGRTTACGA